MSFLLDLVAVAIIAVAISGITRKEIKELQHENRELRKLVKRQRAAIHDARQRQWQRQWQ